eukprot:629757-Rhodomonas_salina.1
MDRACLEYGPAPERDRDDVSDAVVGADSGHARVAVRLFDVPLRACADQHADVGRRPTHVEDEDRGPRLHGSS